MAITETIKSSAYRVWSTALGHWKKYSLWNLAKDTEFDDGNNVETKVGAINGITDSLVANDSSVAVSSAAVYELNDDFASFESAKSTIVSSALGKALSMTSSTIIADIATKIEGVVLSSNLTSITLFNINSNQIGNWINKNYTHTITKQGSCILIGLSTNTGTIDNGACLYTIYKNDQEIDSYQCNGSQGNQIDWNITVSVNEGDIIKVNIKGNSSSGYSYFTHKCYIITAE